MIKKQFELEIPVFIISQEELNALLDPTTYVGNAPEQVDRVVAQTKASGWLND